MIGVDLFSGAGGLSLGAHLAGIDVVLAVENDCHAISTFKANHPRTHVISSDIRSISVVPQHRNIDRTILFGGPPCQGFSTSNQRTRNHKNQNNQLFWEVIRFVKVILPPWVVIENVKGIIDFDGGSYVDYVVKSLSQLGYTCDYKILNASDYGVPQYRNRFFLIASLNHKNIPFPQPLKTNKITVLEAIEDLPVLDELTNFEALPYKKNATSEYAIGLRGSQRVCKNNLITKNSSLVIERFKHVRPGGNWEDIPPTLFNNYKNYKRCHSGIYHRLDLNQPAKVIGNYRKNMLIHPTENRGLSVREAARIQSFPDWFEFKGSLGFQQQQVGNAVPPLLAKHVFSAILEKDN